MGAVLGGRLEAAVMQDEGEAMAKDEANRPSASDAPTVMAEDSPQVEAGSTSQGQAPVEAEPKEDPAAPALPGSPDEGEPPQEAGTAAAGVPELRATSSGDGGDGLQSSRRTSPARRAAGCRGEAAEEPVARAQDFISRELLDELSHEPDDWNEHRSAPTPPLAGFDTPSEQRTPERIETPRNRYYATAHSHQQEVHNREGFMCMDQWDWKTDAPEFVPGSMKAHAMVHTEHGAQQVGSTLSGAFAPHNTWAMAHGHGPSGGRAPLMDSGSNLCSMEGPTLGQLRAQYEWQLRTKAEEVREMQIRMNQMEIEAAQVRASWEVERKSLMRQIGHYREVLERYCIPVKDIDGPSYDNGAIDSLAASCFPGFEPALPSQWSMPETSGFAMACAAVGGCQGESQGVVDPHGTQVSGTCIGRRNEALFLSGSQGGMSVGAAGAVAATATMLGSQGGGGTLGNYNQDASLQPVNSLDSKMRQLGSLLQEDKPPSEGELGAGRGEGACAGASSAPEGSTGGALAADTTAEVAFSNGGSIASTLRAMFPHATIRTQGTAADADAAGGGEDHTLELEHHLHKLENSVGSQVDERALRALQTLNLPEAVEALAKVDELVHAQGGHCRNLSSILQSVCRKIEKRSGRGRRGEEELGPAAPSAGALPWRSGPTERRVPGERPSQSSAPVTGPERRHGSRGPSGAAGTHRTREDFGGGRVARADAHSTAASGRSRRARQLDEDDDAFDGGSDTDELAEDCGPTTREDDHDQNFTRTDSMESQSSALAGRRSNQSWADIHSGDEDHAGAASRRTPMPPMSKEPEHEHWTPRQVEKVARRGFELRRRGDIWDLKISMGGLEPPLTEAGMERYCRWLRVRLTAFRDEHGPESLWHCQGELDFSHNNMSNQMVWMLLETLAKHEVHTAQLRLFANRISQGGVLAICEFIRMNERADAVQEFHLSHNEIDDDSALELLRTLHFQRPKYPPYRLVEGAAEPVLVPVWLRLNHNRIRDPDALRRAAEAEGIATCTAWDRHGCGTSRCCKRECPLVHLCSLNVQTR